MEIQEFINQNKEIQNQILSYIDDEDKEKEKEEEDQDIFKFLEKMQVYETKENLKLFLHLLLKISNNHHRTRVFFDKIESIFIFLQEKIKQTFSNTEIFNLFQSNKRILLILFQNKILIPERPIIQTIFKNKKINTYFYPEILPFLTNENDKEDFTNQLLNEDSENLENYEEKRKNGENTSYICELIRNDSIEDFISHFTRNNFSYLSKVRRSTFETNSYLLKNEPSIIEYATFFGSIRIIQFLHMNEVPLNSSLWIYAIHSRNASLIHFLEENRISPPNDDFSVCIKESIKCHHDEFSEYFFNNYLFNQYDIFIEKNKIDDKFVDYSFRYYNYKYFPNAINDINDISLFYFICKFKYFTIVKFLLNNKEKIKNFESINLIKALKYAASNKENNEVVDFLFDQIKIDFSKILFNEKEFENIKHVSIPSQATSIGDNAFEHCTSLIDIQIPSSVKIIGNYAFKSCSSLVEISIPPSVISIGNYSFDNCTSLKIIEIPSSITRIDYGSFRKCTSLQKIEIPSSVTKICDGAFISCSSLKEISFPSSVKEIGNFAFKECVELKKVSIPNSIKKISNYLFANCERLIEIEIPSSVTEIGNSSFLNCSSLKKIIIPPSVTIIRSNAFDMCSLLKEIIIPSSVVEIEESCFSNCIALNKISIPSSVVKIGPSAFNNCYSLKEISIPSSVTKIGKNVFAGCVVLDQISLPSSLSTENLGIRERANITII